MSLQGVLPHPRTSPLANSPGMMSGYLDSTIMFGVHVTLDAGAIAYRWDSVANTMLTINLATVASNELELPLFYPNDEHFALGCGVDDQDKLLIDGNHHDGTIGSPTKPHFLICNDTSVSGFTNPASWAVMNISHFSGLGAMSYTYSRWTRLANGDLLHFLSQSEGLNVGQGRDWLAFRRRDGVWTPLVGDGHFITSENGPSDEADRTYVEAVVVTNNVFGEIIHVAGTFRIDDTLASSTRDPWYIRSTDGGVTWTNAAGATQTMPMTWANRTPSTVVSGAWTCATGTLWVNPTTGYPDIILKPATSTGVDLRRYSWNGTVWTDAAYTNLTGIEGEYIFEGGRWVIYSNSTRCIVRNIDAGQQFFIGGRIPSNWSGVPDPIWLRDRNVFAFCIGDGNTPVIYTHGRTRGLI